MSKEIINLGLILHNVDNFSMSTFNGRLTLQKTIYLLQAFGVYIGYDFSWYLRGPYSPRLARDGFELQDVYRNFPTKTGKFPEKNIQQRFVKFLHFMKNKKNNPDKLEILASVHFLKNVHPKMKKENMLSIVEQKQSYFTRPMCEKGWTELKKIGLI